MSAQAYFVFTPPSRAALPVSHLIRRAFEKIQIADSSRELSAEEERTGLNALNEILEQWSENGLLVYRSAYLTFQSISGQRVYRIGIGEYIDVERPSSIHTVTVDDVEFEVVNYTPSGVQVQYDPAFPVGVLTFGFEVSGQNVTIRVDQPLRRYESGGEAHGLPPGYERAVILQLACDLAPEFGQSVSPDLLEQRRSAVKVLRDRAQRLVIKPIQTEVSMMRGDEWTSRW